MTSVKASMFPGHNTTGPGNSAIYNNPQINSLEKASLDSFGKG